jgi:uncharacterized protein YjbI with pentapeptide repeats
MQSSDYSATTALGGGRVPLKLGVSRATLRLVLLLVFIILVGVGGVYLLWNARESCVSPNQPEVLPTSLEDLQAEKLKLEIQQLQQEINPSLLRLILQSPLSSLMLAVVGALAAVFNVTRTLSLQRQQQREDMIANFLDKLGSQQESVRLGAAQALARYPTEAVSFLINQLEMDSSQSVRTGVAESLSQVGSRHFHFLRSAILSAQLQRRQTATGLFALEVPLDDLSNIMKLDSDEIREITTRSDFQQEILAWKKKESTVNLTQHEKDELIQNLKAQATRIHQFILDLADVIASSLKNSENRGERLPSDVTEMDLRLTNLSEMQFKRVNFRGSNMRGAFMAKDRLTKVTFIDCTLQSTDFRRSIFEDALFRDSDMSELICTNARLSDVRIAQCGLSQANFSRSSFESVEFTSCSSSGRTRFNGSKIEKAVFADARFYEAEFKGSFLCKSDLSGSTFWRSSFIEADLTDANLADAKLGGGDFRGANLSRANLENVNLGGCNFSNSNLEAANLKGANLKNAKLSRAKLWSISSFDDRTDFDGANWWEADFRKVDEQSLFYKFLESKFPRQIDGL